MGKSHLFLYLSFIGLLLAGTGCNTTRSLSTDEYLLHKNNLVVDSKAIDKGELESYYRQKPNTKFLRFIKFRLAVYNFAHKGKERKWKRWIDRFIGEPPVIYDSVYVDRTAQQFERFLKN